MLIKNASCCPGVEGLKAQFLMVPGLIQRGLLASPGGGMKCSVVKCSVMLRSVVKCCSV